MTNPEEPLSVARPRKIAGSHLLLLDAVANGVEPGHARGDSFIRRWGNDTRRYRLSRAAKVRV
jgi:hypothetical protein